MAVRSDRAESQPRSSELNRRLRMSEIQKACARPRVIKWGTQTASIGSGRVAPRGPYSEPASPWRNSHHIRWLGRPRRPSALPVPYRSHALPAAIRCAADSSAAASGMHEPCTRSPR